MINSRIFSKKSKIFFLSFAIACCSWTILAKGGFLDSLKGTQAKSFDYIHYSKTGVALWRLEGRSPSFLDNAEIAVDEPQLLFFSEKGDAKIKSDRAIISGNADYCRMSGNVVASYQENQSLTTQEANIDLTEEVILFPKPFKAENKFSKLSAESGVLNLKPSKKLTTFGPSELEYSP